IGGPGSSAHDAPFQCSMSGPPMVLEAPPTAHTSSLATAATSIRPSDCAAGSATNFHAVPSQRWMNGSVANGSAPTAHASFRPSAATPFKTLPDPELPLG